MDSSHRITFVAPGELATFLEAEAERRLATVSSTAQQLLSEAYLREYDPSKSPQEIDSQLRLIQKHSDSVEYLGVDARYPYRVDLPEGKDWGRDYAYYAERRGAAKALKRWYE